MDFSITWEDYEKRFKKQSRENCVASDLENTMLEEAVNIIDTVNRLPIDYTHSKPVQSRSRGGGRGSLLFLPDEPQEYTVCNAVYSLTTDLHNRLCLLRGVLMALLPKKEFLGRHLPEVVKGINVFLFYALFHFGTFFL